MADSQFTKQTAAAPGKAGYILSRQPSDERQRDNYFGTPSGLPINDVDELTQGKPSVLIFYATWINKAETIDSIVSRLQNQYGNQITIRKLDVADSKNTELKNMLGINPLPTMVFLRPDGIVSSTLIGMAAYTNLVAGISKMLRNYP